MPERKASAVWRGNLQEGSGQMKLSSGAFEGQYSFASRFQEGPGTNPEELIGAAHAGCFSMALANMLAQAGFKPERISTNANVKFEKVAEGFRITSITLNTEARVPEIDESVFQEHAENAKINCPVSQALKATTINLQARLVK